MTESTNIEIMQQQLDVLLLDYYKEYFNDEKINLSRDIYEDTYTDYIVATTITRKIKVGDYVGEKNIL